MKFTLTYDGELPASTGGNSKTKEKWAIRKHLDPQLRELWAGSEILKQVLTRRLIPKTTSYTWTETHHSVALVTEALAGINLPQHKDRIDLCEPIKSGPRSFFPLIRDTFALRCGLKIKFLRKEPAGQIIYQGGDIDNRLKTLFDALGVPNKDQIMEDPDDSTTEPIYCLLEDDRLIASIEVDTQKLLTKPGASQNEVRLIIDVDVRVTQARSYNQAFLGD